MFRFTADGLTRRVTRGRTGAALRKRPERCAMIFLEKTAEAVGADAIALAHHRGDQAETVLLHAARGSDIRGLCAMRWRRGKLIRPLLDAEPEALRTYLRRIGQPWREDETNACEDYARNRIRHWRCLRWRRLIPTRGAFARIRRRRGGMRGLLCQAA